MKPRRGYKICKIYESGSIVSYSDFNSVTYALNEYVNKPTIGGPLAVFRCLKHVREFTQNNINTSNIGNYIVYKCYYEEHYTRKLWYIDFWNNIKEKTQLPNGTEVASKIKLVEPVYKFSIYRDAFFIKLFSPLQKIS